MVYDETDDLLVVATLGRGVWFLEGASEVVEAASTTRGLGEWKSARTGGLKNRRLRGTPPRFSRSQWQRNDSARAEPWI
jgi:hypothetical protein